MNVIDKKYFTVSFEVGALLKYLTDTVVVLNIKVLVEPKLR